MIIKSRRSKNINKDMYGITLREYKGEKPNWWIRLWGSNRKLIFQKQIHYHKHGGKTKALLVAKEIRTKALVQYVVTKDNKITNIQRYFNGWKVFYKKNEKLTSKRFSDKYYELDSFRSFLDAITFRINQDNKEYGYSPIDTSSLKGLYALGMKNEVKV